MALEIVSLANRGLLKMLMTARSVMPLNKLRQVVQFVPTEVTVLGPPVSSVRLFARLVLVLLRMTASSVDLARTHLTGHALRPAVVASVRVRI